MVDGEGITNPISISLAPTIEVIQKRYYDLPGTVELMRLLWRESVIDGFEFQNLAEWDDENPPRDEAESRLAAWSESQKHTVDEIAALLHATGLPILSVHANRSVGVYLCSDLERDVSRGRSLIHESMSLAERVGAAVCVFHLWDTRKHAFDQELLQSVLRETAIQYPRVKASVENVPTQFAGSTPFQLVRQFEWITLDLGWAALYDELERFESVKERIANVHLRGRLEGGQWVQDEGPFSFYGALDMIRRDWGYTGLLTMEPSALDAGDWEGLVAAMSTLRAP
jgi:hypothetical protein